MEYEKCSCGGRSIAQMVDHICEECEDLYKLCINCQPDYPFKDDEND